MKGKIMEEKIRILENGSPISVLHLFTPHHFTLERKMDEQEEAEEAENQWHTNMDGLTRKS